MTIFRDGVEEEVAGPVRVSHTREGHVVETYTTTEGVVRHFVTLAGTHWCAHGSSVAEAVCDALWKDPDNRPPKEKLVKEIRAAGRGRLITLREFRHLTGACAEGCRVALERAGLAGVTEMTAETIRDKVSAPWGDTLLKILGWDK